VRYEMKHKYPRLGERDLSVAYFPIEGAHGYDRAACVMQDITERKRAEEAIRRSEEKYRSLVANIPDVVWTADTRGVPIFISSNCETLLGYSAQELCDS